MLRRLPALLLFLPLAFSGCLWPRTPAVVGSGRLVDVEETVTGFTEIEVRGALGVVVRQADEHRVAVRADDNVIDRIRIEQIGDSLVLGMDKTRMYRKATMQAEIHLPVLTAVRASGASRVLLDGIVSNKDLEIELAGVSGVDGAASVGDVSMTLSGSSRIALAGRAVNLRLRSSGSIRVDLSRFEVLNADIAAGQASRVIVNVSDRLVASASGASTVGYLGDPESVERSATGAARIERVWGQVP